MTRFNIEVRMDPGPAVQGSAKVGAAMSSAEAAALKATAAIVQLGNTGVGRLRAELASLPQHLRELLGQTNANTASVRAFEAAAHAQDAAVRDVVRSLQSETALLRMGAKDREIAGRQIQIENELRARGVTLTAQHVAQIRGELVAKQTQVAANDNYAAALERERRILTAINGPMDEHKADVLALNSLMARGALTAQQYATALAKSRASVATPGILGKAQASLGVLAPVAGAAGALFAAKGVADLSDAYTGLQNRLKLVENAGMSVGDMSDRLYKIAQNSRTEWTAVAQVFQRTSGALKGMGYSTETVLQFTESLTKAVKMSGNSSVEANNAMVQLSQGLASGTLRGDELRSVLEQLPSVADVIAKGLGVTRGQLRQMGADGKITAKDIIDSFRKAKGDIDAGFAKTAPTLSEQWTKLKNIFMKFIGDLMPILGPLIDALGQLVSAIGAVLSVAGDIVGVLSDAASGMAEFVGISEDAPPTLDQAAKFALAHKDAIAAGLPIATMMSEALTEQATRHDLVVRSIKNFIHTGEHLPEIINDSSYALEIHDEMLRMNTTQTELFTQAQRFLLEIQDRQIATTQKQIDTLAKLRVAVQLAMVATAVAPGKEYGDFAKAFVDIADRADPAAAAARQFTKDVEFLHKSVQNGDLTMEAANKLIDQLKDKLDGAGKSAKAAAKAFDEVWGRVKGYRDATDVVGAATRDLAQAQKDLNLAAAVGKITEEEAVEIYNRKAFMMRDLLDPTREVIASLTEQAGQVAALTEAQRASAQFDQITHDFAMKGVVLTDAQTESIKRLTDAIYAKAEATRLANVETFRGMELGGKPGTSPFDPEAAGMDIRAMQREDQYAKDKATNALINAGRNIPGLTDPMDEYREGWNKGLQGILQDTLEFSGAIEAMFSKVFNAMNTVIVDFVMNTDTDMRALGESIMRMLTEMLLKMIEAQILMALLPGGGAMGAGTGIGGLISGGVQWGGAHATGGEHVVTGSGGTDSQLVMLRATPRETISVRTPAQQAAARGGGGGNNGSGNGGPVDVRVRIQDQGADEHIFKLMASKRGEAISMTHIQKRRRTVRGMV